MARVPQFSSRAADGELANVLPSLPSAIMCECSSLEDVCAAIWASVLGILVRSGVVRTSIFNSGRKHRVTAFGNPGVWSSDSVRLR